MPQEPKQPVKNILIPILIQDPSVLTSDEWKGYTIHPSGAKCESGFFDGPACERVAIVDIDVETGKLRSPAKLVPGGSRYNNVGGYDVHPPTRGGQVPIWQLKSKQDIEVDINHLSDPDTLKDPYLKVNVFGSVIRTLGFMESAIGLARRTTWAFGREQLLVVPAAGEYENAFYHRESGSLRFFYFTPVGDEIPRIFTALSQDVVVHETAHAVIDAVAPDLYHAITPDSLAVHEGVADITASLVSVLNREYFGEKFHSRAAQFLQDLSKSNRFSRFAEQFGTKARGQETLRELINNCQLGDDTSNPDVVNPASPHAMSEVISGALFSVLQNTALRYEGEGTEAPLRMDDRGGRHGLSVSTASRIASLALKGLDWLPPGDISLADYARAILAADHFHLPNLTKERELLINEFIRRNVLKPEGLPGTGETVSVGPIDFEAMCAKRSKLRSFVQEHRSLFGVPDGSAFEISQTSLHRKRLKEISRWFRTDTMANLDRPARPVTVEDAEILIIKVAWWKSEPNPLGSEYGKVREVKVGTTMAVGHDGLIYALLRGGQEPELVGRRDAFLIQQAKSGVLLPQNQADGPDGKRLSNYLHAVKYPGGTRFEGGYRSLHLVGDMS